MAGGVGSRFWPISTPEYPKQFIDVMGVGRSLIQLTVDRLKPICPVENMWVVTNEKYISIVKEQIPDMPTDNILAEPEARNTAPLHRLRLLENPEAVSQCQHRCNPLRCPGHKHNRISACSQQGIKLYIRQRSHCDHRHQAESPRNRLWLHRHSRPHGRRRDI